MAPDVARSIDWGQHGVYKLVKDAQAGMIVGFVHVASGVEAAAGVRAVCVCEELCF